MLSVEQVMVLDADIRLIISRVNPALVPELEIVRRCAGLYVLPKQPDGDTRKRRHAR